MCLRAHQKRVQPGGSQGDVADFLTLCDPKAVSRLSEMARIAFMDFSGIKPLKKQRQRVRTSVFVETPATLDPSECQLPETTVVLNGRAVVFQTRLSQESGGWLAQIEVESDPLEPSASFAEFYFNQTLDIAALRHASPFQVLPRGNEPITPHRTRFHNVSASAVITAEDITQSTQLAFLFYSLETDLLRSIGWYRRGLSSPDGLLVFLGLWNSIEIAAACFCEKNDKTEKGSKNQIHQLLGDYLPQSERQFFKPDSDELGDWIKRNYNMRVQIAHGLGSTELNTFGKSEAMIPSLRAISTAVLRVLSDARCRDNDYIARAIQQANENRE